MPEASETSRSCGLSRETAPSQNQSIALLQSSAEQKIEHAEYATRKAGQLLSWYRKSDDWNTDEFLTGIAANLAQYPKDIIDEVCHPAKGIASRMKFPPNAAEIRDACEAIQQPRLKAARKQEQIDQQLAERESLENPREQRQTWEEAKAELATRGFGFAKPASIGASISWASVAASSGVFIL